ncbi:MAG: type II secretion system F family protein [Hyphomicrobium sp.]|jgi:general secretion pathway protein F
MPRYRYKAYDQRGSLTEGEIETRTREAALEALHRRGYFPLDVAESKADPVLRWWEREVFGDGALPLAGLALFTRELATLIKADLPLDESLRIVSLQPLIPSRVRACTRALLEAVRGGASLSGAMSARGQDFPEYYWRLIQAGEASGSLSEVLDDMSGFLERSNEVRAQVGSALLYPAVLLFAAAIAVGVILTVLLPTVLPLFKDAGAAPPASLQFLVDAEAFVAGNWALVLALAIGLGVALFAASRNAGLRLWFDRTLLKIPVVGVLSGNRETARLARTLATLTRNGVPMLDAVRISGAVLGNRAFIAAVADAGEALKEGGSLSKPLEQSGLFSELSLRLIAVGEQTGQLEPMLMRVAGIYEATVQRQLARLMTLLTPALTLFVGGLVGSLILSVMSAILSVNDLALQ